MSVIVKPFKGFRPRPEQALQIASPPYDVLNSAEAREMAKGNPLSFLHVVKPEIDLDPEIDLYDDKVYATGAANLRRMLEENYTRDEKPCFYLYQQKMGDHVQAGIVARASVEDYLEDRIKKHELTRADKEADRTRHVNELNANTGPVFLTYKRISRIDEIADEIKKTEPIYDFESPDGVGHTFWKADDPAMLTAIEQAFSQVPCLYVADGHHRSASGANVGKQRREANADHKGDEAYNYFMAVLFPHNQLKILDYNRVVKDLNNMSKAQFLETINERFEVTKESGQVRPTAAKTFGMHIEGEWYKLTAKEGTYPKDDPVGSLDVAILQNNLLAPALGIKDPRTDKRIDFVGGIRGLGELEKRVNEGWKVAFSLHPTSIEQLMAIADAGEIMPPKSTWFEPKLRSGLIIHSLE
ncbi:MAG: DUF1015 domain-containing protein [Planctomycetota bacterium]|jgi:uncharacterized protein (DUF1015 family)